jgi:hypothetical protein
MPLKKGSGKATIRYNTEEMIRAGHSPAQAEAAAYSLARKSRRRSPTKRKPAKKSTRR